MTASRTRPHRSETRDRIVAAAAAEFSAHGFDGTSLARVADRAGLTKGAIYSSFRDKDALFEAAVSQQIADRIAAVEQGGAATDPADLARRIGTALTTASSEDADWHVAFVEYWIRAVRNPQVRESFTAHRRAARTAIAHTLSEQQQRWQIEFTIPPDDLAVVILALSNGLAIERAAAADVDDALFGTVLTRLLTPDLS